MEINFLIPEFTISGHVSILLLVVMLPSPTDPFSVCAYQTMIMCSWNCNIILYSTIFDLGGKN